MQIEYKTLKMAVLKSIGVVVYPNEVFLSNEHFNPCTEANGWANAGIIVNGRIEE